MVLYDLFINAICVSDKDVAGLIIRIRRDVRDKVRVFTRGDEIDFESIEAFYSDFRASLASMHKHKINEKELKSIMKTCGLRIEAADLRGVA